MDDLAQLLTAAQAGDEGAFEALARSQRDRLFSIAYRVTGDSSTAEDVPTILVGEGDGGDLLRARARVLDVIDLGLDVVQEPNVEMGRAFVGDPEASPPVGGAGTVLGLLASRAPAPPASPFVPHRPAESALQVLGDLRREDRLVVFLVVPEIEGELHP